MKQYPVLAVVFTMMTVAAACGAPPAPATSGGTAPTSAPVANAATSQCAVSSMPAPAASFKQLAAPAATMLEAAKKEGKVNWYTDLDDDTTGAISSAFEAAYPGIDLVVSGGLTADLAAKFTASADAGVQEADVINGSNTTFYSTSGTKYFADLNTVIPGFATTWPKELQYSIGNGATIPIILWKANGFAYNSQLVPANLAPKQLRDLLKPEFKGKILAIDPNSSLSFTQWYEFLLNLLGDSDFETLGQSVIKTPMYPSQAPEVQALAAGAGWVGLDIAENQASTLASQGAPVKWVLPDDASGPRFVMGVAAQAPHPNAVAVFVNWVLSPQAEYLLTCGQRGGSLPFPDTFLKGIKNFVQPNDAAQKSLAKINQLWGLKGKQ